MKEEQIPRRRMIAGNFCWLDARVLILYLLVVAALLWRPLAHWLG